jgi:hypothetical protein
MARVRIVHWKEPQAAPLIEACRACGFEAEYDPVRFPDLAKLIRANPPDALVIDLTCLPSHGRESAIYLRRTKYARHLPLVFVDGEPEKVEKVREQLPDATFTTRKQICSGIKAALAKTIAAPVLPPSMEERFASRTVAQKLGMKPDIKAAVIEAPRNYVAVIGELPQGAELLEDPESVCPVTLWFVEDLRGFKAGLRRMQKIADRTKLWIIWRKGGKTELTSNLIREGGIDVGLVDYKICSVSEHWSGMAFGRKRS